MREHLLGYLLGALEPAEQKLVERSLQTDPELRRLMEALERRLDALNCLRDADEEPPAGLAERTCNGVARMAPTGYASPSRRESTNLGASRRADAPHRASEKAVTLAAAADPPVGRRWSVPDMLVAACIAVAAGVLFFPAIAESRHKSRVTLCQNNLRSLGVALVSYSDISDGRFPYVRPTGNLGAAGIYAPILNQHDLLPDKKQVACPAKSLAGRSSDLHVPTIEELENATATALARLQREMGGDYAYSLGYFEDGRHQAPRNSGRTHYALLADAPASKSGSSQSPNHGGRGQNVLFEDQSVRYLVGCMLAQVGDDIYRNGDGLISAGLNCDDSVLGDSSTPPLGPQLLRR